MSFWNGSPAPAYWEHLSRRLFESQCLLTSSRITIVVIISTHIFIHCFVVFMNSDWPAVTRDFICNEPLIIGRYLTLRSVKQLLFQWFISTQLTLMLPCVALLFYIIIWSDARQCWGHYRGRRRANNAGFTAAPDNWCSAPQQIKCTHTLSKYTLLLSKMQGEDISAVPTPQ